MAQEGVCSPRIPGGGGKAQGCVAQEGVCSPCVPGEGKCTAEQNRGHHTEDIQNGIEMALKTIAAYKP